MEKIVATDRLENIVGLAKRRGFVYPSSEIYGGLRASWDYGPLGVELKNNVKRQWWKSMVMGREDVVGLDSCVILAKEVWEASGHVATFSDPLTECTACHKRYRADHLEEAFEAKHKKKPESLSEINCPACGNKGQFTTPKQFSGLLKTFLGPVEDESGLAYLRPETAQGIFINFDQVMTTSRKKPPFGIGQIGKSFRNEITPGNFIFRTREFEQMEMEFFVVPGSDEEWHQYWIDTRMAWYVDLGINPERLRIYDHPKEKLSHYSKRTADIEYKFEFAGTEWGELEGIVAVLPLSRNADLSPKARDLADQLRKNWNIDFDDAGAIGRRYRRQDEIGTPYCITIDFETLEDNAVTIRDRDTMAQERIGLDQVQAWLAPRLLGC